MKITNSTIKIPLYIFINVPPLGHYKLKLFINAILLEVIIFILYKCLLFESVCYTSKDVLIASSLLIVSINIFIQLEAIGKGIAFIFT